MDNESMGHLYSVLSECERKCNNCEYKWKHVLENMVGYCPNMYQKSAVKRVINRRLARLT